MIIMNGKMIKYYLKKMLKILVIMSFFIDLLFTNFNIVLNIKAAEIMIVDTNKNQNTQNLSVFLQTQNVSKITKSKPNVTKKKGSFRRILKKLEEHIPKIMAIVTAVLTSFKIIVELLTPSEIKSARRNLKMRERHKVNTLQTESLLFDINAKRHFFYRKIPIRDLHEKKVKFRKLFLGSYVITGGAGYGKSAVLKQAFIRSARRNRFSHRHRNLFLDAEELQSAVFANDSSLVESINAAKLHRLTLYIDGPDEVVVPADYKEFEHYLEMISRSVHHISVRISCRTEFQKLVFKPEGNAYKYQLYKVESWTNHNLLQYVKKILMKLDTKKETSPIYHFFCDEVKWEKLEGNPLLCKMLLYIKFNNGQYMMDDNRYLFYMVFLKSLVTLYQIKSDESPCFNEIIGEYAKEVYDVIYNDNRSHEVPFRKEFSSVLKKVHNGKAIFKHETFFEFMMSVYVCKQFYDLSEESIRVLSCEYTNAFADFISQGILTIDTECIQRNLMLLYSGTLKIENIAKERGFPSIQMLPKIKANRIKAKINNLDNFHFFTLKYQIVFRLGRLNREDQILKDFLAFVYNEDYHVFSDNVDSNEQEKYRIILKRCCAISASFIGKEDIELDYAKHMLAYRGNNEYQELYDKVNQFHTLLYYGDVPMARNGEINIREMDNIDIFDCSKACRKRISRLSKLNEGSLEIENMDDKMKRIYYFRVFDIATLYTFIHSRNNIGNLQWLDENALDIIRNFQTDFRGISSERKMLLEDIKKHVAQELESMSIR